jgi:cytochrome c oxidase cbb3-type subunit 3
VKPLGFVRALLLWTAVATGCRLDGSLGTPDAGARDASAELLDEGGRVFAERCSPCHGATGHGDGQLADILPIRPRNYHRDEFKWGTSQSDIVATIQGGRSGVMPAFEGALTERELRAVAYFVWSWIPPDRREPEAPGSPAGGPLGGL